MAAMTEEQKAAKTARDKARRAAQRATTQQNATQTDNATTQQNATQTDNATTQQNATQTDNATTQQNATQTDSAEDALHTAAFEVARGLARKLVAERMNDAIAELANV